MGSPVKPWETSDLGTAAFVHMHGLELLGCRRGERNKFFFAFADPEGRCKELQVQYINSDCRRFDSSVRSLKKLVYER